MGKLKKEKALQQGNWVPGWFGSTLMMKRTPLNVQKHLKERIAKAAHNKNPTHQDRFEKAESERLFGM